jgi:uncharacterized protein (TIGR04255 family)
MIKKLPKPPLTEVVFEMRWALGEPHPVPFDPGYPYLVDTFTSYAKKKGFNNIKDLQPEYSSSHFGVSRRYYKGEKNFPLLQIGPGIFAANDGVDYEWSTFSAMAIGGAVAVVAEYPSLKDFLLNLVHFELRYIDTFDEGLIGTADLITFINEGTEASLSLPQLTQAANLDKTFRGRLLLQVDAKTPARSVFSIDIASAKRDETPVVRLETKVISQGEHVPVARPGKAFEPKVRDWLEQAHVLTSDSFRKLVTQQVYDKFQ